MEFADSPGASGLFSRPTVEALVLALGRLAVVGFLAIGASGLLAWDMGAAFGKAFVAGDPPGVTYTAARCADFAEYAPGVRTCAEAATSHHFDETVSYRTAAGVLGLLGLPVYLVLRRRFRDRSRLLPRGFEATIGTALFGLAATGLVVFGLGALTPGVDHGAGSLLSAAPFALGVALVYARSLYRTLT